jgi:hypothetical protein
LRKRDKALTVVTGASSNHYRCLCNLLESLDHHEPRTDVVVYDLGLEAHEASALRSAGRQVVRFAFERCPAFFGTQAQRRKPCCWKPVLIREVIDAAATPVLWLDAGNIVHERLDRVRCVLSNTGFYSPVSVADIARFTHPDVLRLLDAAPEILTDLNRNGAIIGFGRNQLGLDLSGQWRDCALRQEIMWPADWTKDRWRSDQAILSVLVAQARRRKDFALVDEALGITIQNDNLTRAEARYFMTCPALKPARNTIRRMREKRRPIRRLRRFVRRLRRWVKAMLVYT